MRLKTISKFVLGAVCGSLVTLSIYATADEQNGITPINSQQMANTIPVDDVNNFAKVYAITKNYYVESVNDTKLMKGAIDGMLNNLDPHSDYLDADDFKQLSETKNYTILTKHVIKPHRTEVQRNKASRSAKLRIIEKN